MNHFNGQKYDNLGSVGNFFARSTLKRPRYTSNVFFFFLSEMLCFKIEFYILNGKEVSFTERLCHIAEEISCRLSTKSFSSPTCKALAYKNLVPRSLVDEAVANIFT